jgi:hypothetical protein
VPIMGFGYQQNLNFANPLSLITWYYGMFCLWSNIFWND